MDSPLARVRRALPLCAAAAALLLPSAALAAPQWKTPFDASNNTNSNFSSPQAAMGPSGDAAVAYKLAGQFLVKTRAPGGSFGAADPLSANSTALGMGFDAAGTLYLVWDEGTQVNGSDASAIKYASKPRGGSMSAPVTLDYGQVAAPTTPRPTTPTLAVTPSGEVVAVWLNNTGQRGVRMARKPAGSSSFGTPFDAYGGLNNNKCTGNLTIDVNDGGDAVVGYVQNPSGGGCSGNTHAGAFFQPESSSTQTSSVLVLTTLSASDDTPAVGIDNAGNASLLVARAGTGNSGTIKVANHTAGNDTWSALGDVDTTAGGRNPRLAENGNGQQAATWTRVNTGTGSAEHVFAGTRSGIASNSFSPQEIGPAASGVFYVNADVTVNANGTGLAVFNTTTAVKSARSSGSSWTVLSPDVVTTNQSGLGNVSGDDQGNAVAAWTATNGSGTTSAFAAGFDGAGPRLSNISFPASAQTGQSFPYSVTASDVWSTVASTGWAFGEGSTANGASGNFAYANAGNFTATVTSTDSIGNQSSATRNIAVSAPGGGGGGDGGGGGGGGGADTTPPVFSAAGMTSTKFRLDPKGPVEPIVKAAAPKGTTFTYTLSEAARVLISIEQKAKGRKVKGKCAKPTAKNRKAKACSRFVKWATIGQDGLAGANLKRFSGRVTGKSIKPGSYRAVLTAKDAAGNVSAPKVLSFKVVRK